MLNEPVPDLVSTSPRPMTDLLLIRVFIVTKNFVLSAVALEDDNKTLPKGGVKYV